MPRRRGAPLAVIALTLLGCSSASLAIGPEGGPDAARDTTFEAGASGADAPVDPPGNAASTADASGDEVALVHEAARGDFDASSCQCASVGDAGVFVTSLSCYCQGDCPGYAAAISAICSKPYDFDVLETQYSGCDLKRVEYLVGVSTTTEFFDVTSGALVGAIARNDMPGLCPGTQQSIGLTLSAGTFEAPASCQTTLQRDPCPDGGSPHALH